MVSTIPFQRSASIFESGTIHTIMVTLIQEFLIFQLLEKDASIRLGSLGAGDGDILFHPFFNKIDWTKLERREYTPPFKPEVVSD